MFFHEDDFDKRYNLERGKLSVLFEHTAIIDLHNLVISSKFRRRLSQIQNRMDAINCPSWLVEEFSVHTDLSDIRDLYAEVRKRNYTSLKLWRNEVFEDWRAGLVQRNEKSPIEIWRLIESDGSLSFYMILVKKTDTIYVYHLSGRRTEKYARVSLVDYAIESVIKRYREEYRFLDLGIGVTEYKRKWRPYIAPVYFNARNSYEYVLFTLYQTLRRRFGRSKFFRKILVYLWR